MTAPLAFDITGRVVAVANGDTLTVLVSNKGKTKISLHQIDAPEKKQDFGQRSKQSLSDLTYGKQVRVEAFDTDKYGRTGKSGSMARIPTSSRLNAAWPGCM